MKIFVTYHKPTPLIQNEILTPIHAGAALSDKDLGMIGDDTGDHISERNPFWCELTVLYWMWKNVDTDYYGLFHYRRLMALKRRVRKYFFDGSPATLKSFGLNAGFIEKECLGYDIVMPSKLNVRPAFKDDNLMTVFDFYARDHIESDLKVALDVIKEMYPEYVLASQVVMNQKRAYFFNMFIMSKPLFHKYANWLFDILFEVEKRIVVRDKDPYQKRVFGFLSERLINVFVFHERCVNPSLKIKDIKRMPFGIFDGKFPYEQMLKSGRTWEIALKCEVLPQVRMASPKVSVIVSEAHDVKYLAACMNALIYQSLKDVEIIVVCNKLQTDVIDILASYAAKDQRIIPLLLEDTTTSVARVQGVKQAQGAYLFFIKGDDYIERTTLEEMLKRAQASEAQVVCCTVKEVDAVTEKADCGSCGNQLQQEFTHQPFSVAAIANHFFDMPIYIWGKLYSRALIENVQAEFLPGKYATDLAFFVKMMLDAQKILFIDKACYMHRVNFNENVSGKRSDDLCSPFQVMDECEGILKSSPCWEVLRHSFLTYRINQLWQWSLQPGRSGLENNYRMLREDFLSYDLSDYDLKQVDDGAFGIYAEVISSHARPNRKPPSRFKSWGRSVEHLVKQIFGHH